MSFTVKIPKAIPARLFLKRGYREYDKDGVPFYAKDVANGIVQVFIHPKRHAVFLGTRYGKIDWNNMNIHLIDDLRRDGLVTIEN